MNMLKAIKHERRLTLKNWRYRLLHWFFNKTEETGPKELPEYFYTHFCPLFHLTNLIALFAPVIIVWKVLKFVLFRLVVPYISYINDVWHAWLDKREAQRYARRLKEKKEQGPPEPSMTKIFRWKSDHYDIEPHQLSFNDVFYGAYHDEMEAWNDDINYWKERIESVRLKYEQAYKRAEERRRIFRERVTFWVNFSSSFVKWALYGLYIVMFVGLVWSAWTFGGATLGAVLSLLLWVWECFWLVDWATTGKVLLGGLAIAGLLGGFAWLNSRFRVVSNTTILVSDAVGSVVSPVLSPIWGALCAACSACNRGIHNVAEFFSIFYEENCPPITIVSGEDAEIDSE